jgi:hypothetical protein
MTEMIRNVNLKTVIASVAAGSLGVVISGGGGFFVRAARTFKQALDGIPQPPLLRCAHCLVFAIICPHCQTALVMDEQPQSGALLRCGSCAGAFGLSERSDDLDLLVEK